MALFGQGCRTLGGRQAGRQSGRGCAEKSPSFVPQSHTAAAQAQGAKMTEPGFGWDLGGFTGLGRHRPQLAQ